jgi:hypothetical protein
MKTTFVILSTLFVFLVFTPQYGFAQENAISKKEQKKLDKERKKQEKEAAELAEQKEYAELLQDKHYVFMANTLAGDAGASYAVTPKYNFLKVDGEQIVFQFSFDGIVGWNGIGGITLKGEAEDYRFVPAKNVKKPIRVNAKMKSNTHWGTPSFTLTVFGGGYANIIITIKGSTLNMRGQLVKIEDSGVYEGTEILIDR